MKLFQSWINLIHKNEESLIISAVHKTIFVHQLIYSSNLNLASFVKQKLYTYKLELCQCKLISYLNLILIINTILLVARLHMPAVLQNEFVVKMISFSLTDIFHFYPLVMIMIKVTDLEQAISFIYKLYSRICGFHWSTACLNIMLLMHNDTFNHQIQLPVS